MIISKRTQTKKGKVIIITVKKCTKCNEEKELSLFGICKRERYGRKAVCRECRAKEFQKEIEEKGRIRERYKKGDVKYKNKEEIRERQKEYYRNYLKTEKGKEQNRRKQLKRNAKKKEVDKLGVYTPKQWEECLKFFDYKDAYTGLPMGNISVDHIIPQSKNGTLNINNILPCEKAINSSKNNKEWLEWYTAQPFYSKKRERKIKEWIKKNTQVNLFEIY